MVNLMRKYQQTLMLVVTVLVIISFVYLYNGSRGADRAVTDRVGTIYGTNIRSVEYSREERKFRICQPLGLVDLWSSLVGREARSEEEAVENFVWNTFVLRHEADALGIQASEEDVLTTIQKVPDFQTNGVYDSSKFKNFIQNIAPLGLTAGDVEKLVRDHIRLIKLKALVGSTLNATPEEVRSIFDRRSQKTAVSFVRLKLEDFTKDVKVSDEDVKQRYEERKDTLKSEELRKVKYVGFTMPPSDTPVIGKERTAQMSKLVDRAQEFALAMTEKGASFEEAAKKFEVPAKETAEFSVLTPPPELSQIGELGSAVFEKLTT
ncbi:MAG: SurA N-terminal domain-containing protein, partial [Verrucomicrobiota bacterium]